MLTLIICFIVFYILTSYIWEYSGIHKNYMLSFYKDSLTRYIMTGATDFEFDNFNKRVSKELLSFSLSHKTKRVEYYKEAYETVWIDVVKKRLKVVKELQGSITEDVIDSLCSVNVVNNFYISSVGTYGSGEYRTYCRNLIKQIASNPIE